jgi:hypothetical protein
VGAALVAGTLLAAAPTAHADAPRRPDGAPGPRTLNPQPEPPGILHDARAAARFSLTVDGLQIASFSELAGISEGDQAARKPPTIALKRGKNNSMEIFA